MAFLLNFVSGVIFAIYTVRYSDSISEIPLVSLVVIIIQYGGVTSLSTMWGRMELRCWGRVHFWGRGSFLPILDF